MIPLLLASAALSCPSSFTANDAWPGWRGPQGEGIATGSPPLRWSESENVRWKVAIPGKGLSCPVVFGELVFLTTAIPTGEAAKPDAGGTPPAPEGRPEPPAPGGGEGEGEGGGRGGRGGRGEGGGGGGRGGRGIVPTEQEYVVLALNRADGSVAWRQTARIGTPHQGTHGDGSFASPTVATDGKLVIASFGSPGIFAYDMKGELQWELDLGDMDIMRGFGEGSSPVLVNDTVVIDWEHEGDSFLVALDAKSGDERWRVTRSQGTSWATPLVVEREEGAIVVVPGARTTAYDLATGAEVWSHGEVPPARPQGEGGRGGGGGGGGVIASPVRHGDLVLLATGGRSGGFTALRLAGSKGELDGKKSVAWTQTGDAPHVPSPIAYDGIYYSPKGDTGVISAFDVATGEKLYGPERLATVANLYASPVAADGRLYFAGRDGEIDVIAAGPALEVLASNKLEDRFDSSPAIVADELYLRGLKHLYCIAASEGSK